MSKQNYPKKAVLKKIFLNIFTTTNKYQIIHIHNDGLAKFVLVARFIMFNKNPDRLKKIVVQLLTQEKELNLSLEEVSYDYNSKKFDITLQPLTITKLIKVSQEFIPEQQIIMKKGSRFINNIQFLVDKIPRDSIYGQNGFGDQACNFKVI